VAGVGAGTIAGAITGGKITLKNCEISHIEAIIEKLKEVGCEFTFGKNEVTLIAPEKIRAVDVKTTVFPGFPTDMQAQWIALMSVANGTSSITDTIYKDRFTHVPELCRLGAEIKLNDNTAIVHGVQKLKGASVMSTDLRASASLILAGLVAEGRTDVLRVYHIDRGYEKIEKKFEKLGASIWREEGGL
jgi:UDP-N-acetylglucosamine 1-carboxyvinyltransferase